MMAILVSLAVPYFADWRKNSQFKAGARDLASAFQEAKSVAISRNIQARVVIDPSANTYQIELGSLPNNSTWPGSLLKSNTLSSQVGMSTTNACNTATLTSIIFNPNGTTGQSGIFCICIMDGTTPKYQGRHCFCDVRACRDKNKPRYHLDSAVIPPDTRSLFPLQPFPHFPYNLAFDNPVEN